MFLYQFFLTVSNWSKHQALIKVTKVQMQTQRSLSETAAYILAVEVLCYLLCSGQEWRYFLSNPISNEHMYVCIQSIV